MIRSVIVIGALLGLGGPVSGQRLLVCGWSSNSLVAYDGVTGRGEGALVGAGSGGLGNPHSVRFGPDGLLYVTSVATNRVLRYDPSDGGFLGVFVDPSGTPLSAPTDAVFGPDGDLYVASFNNGLILRFDGGSGDYAGVFASGDGPARVEMLAWGPDGHLYATTGEGHSVQRFDGASGEPLGDFVAPGLGGLDDPHGFTFGPDGHLYVTAFDEPLALKFDGTTGAWLDDFVIENDPNVPGDETGGLTAPHGIAFGPDGAVYICSFGTNQVLRYDAATGAFLGVFASGGGLGQPTHLVFEAARIPGDTDGDGDVDVDDLVALLLAWGPCPTSGACPTDTDGDGDTDVDDLVTLILNWGG